MVAYYAMAEQKQIYVLCTQPVALRRSLYRFGVAMLLP